MVLQAQAIDNIGMIPNAATRNFEPRSAKNPESAA
jgi:hypothetical protein